MPVMNTNGEIFDERRKDERRKQNIEVSVERRTTDRRKENINATSSHTNNDYVNTEISEAQIISSSENSEESTTASDNSKN